MGSRTTVRLIRSLHRIRCTNSLHGELSYALYSGNSGFRYKVKIPSSASDLAQWNHTQPDIFLAVQVVSS